MKTVAVVLPTLVQNDAMGNDVLIEYNLLKKNGYNALLFAENREQVFEKDICNINDLLKADVIIYHHGINWELGETILRNHKGNTRILKYHNVTPVEFMEKYDPHIAAIVEAGRNQTARLIKKCTHFFSDSQYNQTELIELGADISKCKVIAPFHHVEELSKIEADISKLELLIRLNRPVVFFVGRQAPNKGLHHFVRVAKAYTDFFGYNILFAWAGGRDDRFQKYYDEVNTYVSNNRLEDVVSILGKISLQELKSYYTGSKIFLILSEHEGFCVPVIEAQCMGLPIIALRRSAVGETAGDEQLLFDEIEYDRIAVAIEILLKNIDYSLYLSEKGKKNYENRFCKSVMEDKFLSALKEVIYE